MTVDNDKVEAAALKAIEQNIFGKTELLMECINKQLNIYFPNNPNAHKLIYTMLVNAAKEWGEEILKEKE